MKIDNIQLNKIAELYNKQKQDQKAEKGEKGDKLNISNKAVQFKGIKEELKASSDIRQEKVADLKKAVTKGNYEIDSEKVAEKILDRLG